MSISNLKKVPQIALLAMLSLGTIFTSCEKDESTKTTEITEEDAYDVVEGTLSSETYGLTETVEQASLTAEEQACYTSEAAIECGTLYTIVYAVQDTSSNLSYDYNAEANYELTCTNLKVPSIFDFETTVTGTYDALRMSSQDSFESEITIAGLEPSETTAIFNGSYERNGTQKSKVSDNRNFTSQVINTLNDLKINKSNHKIEGGIAMLNILLTTDDESKSFTAHLTFHANNTAILDINGTVYTVYL
ncbi:MAG: hypothetical protein ABJH98_12955 [Reichenbachiella sp.]